MSGRVKYYRGGREVSQAEFGEGIKADLYQRIASDIESRIGAIECPEHHENPTVLMTEARSGMLSFEVRACCDAIKERVENALPRSSGPDAH